MRKQDMPRQQVLIQEVHRQYLCGTKLIIIDILYNNAVWNIVELQGEHSGDVGWK